MISPLSTLFSQQHAQQRTFSRSVATNKAHLHVVGDRGLGPIQQYLVTVALMSILDLQQYSHRRTQFSAFTDRICPAEAKKPGRCIGRVGICQETQILAHAQELSSRHAVAELVRVW